MKQVIIKVNKFGDAKIDAEGFTGESCIVATQAIEQVLGGGGKRNLKPEYDQPAESGDVSQEQALRF